MTEGEIRGLEEELECNRLRRETDQGFVKQADLTCRLAYVESMIEITMML